jgi:hypothetical protein
MSFFPAGTLKFYANILALVNVNLFLYMNDQFALKIVNLFPYIIGQFYHQLFCYKKVFMLNQALECTL